MSNKDEALRAKDLAEKFMRNRNFTTARRLAIKAQKMDASLEDVVSRMIKVCDVHCAAMEKFGDESDWYKILQVEPNADDNTIKKQYKKLALYLHPDKTQAPGAENAFKTIGEAQRILLDKDSRRLHDMRRKPVKKPAPAASSVQPQQAPTFFTQRAPAASTFQAPTAGFFTQRAPAASTFQAPTMGSFTQRAPSPSYRPQQAPAPSLFTQRVSQTNVHTTWKRPETQGKPQTQSTEFGGGSRFWSSCAYCNMKCEYSWECINHLVSCVACGRQYVAFRETFPGPPVQVTFHFPQQNKVPTQEAAKVAEKQPESTTKGSSSKEAFGAKSSGVPTGNINGLPVQATFPFPQQSKVPTQEAGKAAEKQPEISGKVSSSKEGSRAKGLGISAENGNGKRKRKQIVESSDGSCSENSIDCKEVPAVKQGSGTTGGQHARRSVRSKQQILYNENQNDDDNKEEDAESAEESNFLRKSHENHLFSGTLPNGINRTKKIKADQVGRSRDSSSGSATDAVIFECADADFSNFEGLREGSIFKANQTWAMYDDMDRMPRFYAIIRKVVSEPSFKAKIQWLEAKPDDSKAVQWVRKKLPISVGTYRLGGKEDTTEAPSFSHQIHSSEGSRQNIILVYPRIGQTWALFKNWDITWSCGRKRSSHEHEYEYEFVEILSEYSEGVAIEVAYLRKVKGFASVFCRIATGAGSDTFQIPPNEFLRFSHNIPSFRLTGKERTGVPAGSFELDTAALPQNIEEDEAVPVLREAAKSNQPHQKSHPSSDPDCILIPSFDFHDFSAERLEGKFENGQIWSLNSKEDGLPKCYVMIQKVLWKPMFLLQINRLELESLPENVTQWQDNKMPVSCGNFRLKDGRAEALTKVTGFSHQIKAQQLYGENKYTVLPKTGEVWAMYKNWSETMKVASLKKCEYELVEVLDDNESYIEVMMLEKVPGLISVFKEKVEEGKDVKKVIPRCELLRFSHYVSAFRLTGEKDGALRGCIELDSSALPLRKS